ncbi:oleosin 16.4 kDa-like [Cynara cardunculus var. scolymus]|uniref:Oleosin n=1 Tax=Cynara cardunculus var. scolymus TaxID=59895 RepID=A0A103YBZ8_CYNCS|nr:oleosin 16.4 kDa-like [Cynara cardunculus var. scolymus]KVI06296.1 Oleosin [Cynara cardunculus var. scolymus]
MAEYHRQPHNYGYQQQHHPMDTTKGQHYNQQSTSKLLAVLTLFPVGGVCFLLAGLTLTVTLIGIAIATPVFVIFSPILVPAALSIALAITGFITSGAFGITALSSLTYIFNYFRKTGGSSSSGSGVSLQDSMDYAKRRAQDTAGYVGEKVKDVGQRTQDSAARA